MKKKIVFGSIVLIIVALVLFRVFSPKQDSSQQTGFGGGGFRRGRSSRPQGPVAVETAKIKYGYIEQRKEFTGTIKASYTYEIRSKVSGRLVTISKRIGDRVMRDEIVGSLDNTEYQQAVQEALAQTKISAASISEAQAQVTYLQREVQRVKELVSKGISSQAELDDVTNKLNSQKSRLELARAQAAQKKVNLDQARTRLEHTTLRAALSGFVAARHTDGGALLSPNSPVLTIVGIDTVFVEIPATERDYPLIAKGQTAQISVEALPEKQFLGVVRNTAPSFDASTRTAMIEIAVVNDSLLLKPGLFARVSITLARKESAQLVPSEAVITRDQKNAVFVVIDHDALLVPVSVGLADNDHVEIVEPKLKGNVVTLGAHLLADGSKVLLESDKMDNVDAEATKNRMQRKDGLSQSKDGAAPGKGGPPTRSRGGETQNREKRPQSTSENKGARQ